MAAKKKPAAKKATPAKKAPSKPTKPSRWRPAAEPPPTRGSAAAPPMHSVGKTHRLRAARLCPGGEAIDKFESKGDGCGRCPSVDQCSVARFSPKAKA